MIKYGIVNKMNRGNFIRSYDRLMYSADTALRSPRIASALGQTAIDLRKIFESAFLPNFRHGELSVPHSHRGDVGIAIVPFTEEQVPHLASVINPLFDGVPLSWPTNKTYSQRYDLDTSEEAEAFLQSVQNPVEVPASQPGPAFKPDTAETIAYAYIAKDGKTIQSTRPVILVPSSLTTNTQLAAGTALHEGVHVSDLLRDGFLQLITPTYRVATELCAYNAGSIVGGQELTDQIESMRIAEVDPARPFAPTPMLKDFMLQNGFA